MTKKFKVALVGCGKFGAGIQGTKKQSHLTSLVQNSGFELEAFVDLDVSKAENFADHFGGLAFSSIDAALKSCRPNLVSVVSPNDSHFQLLKSIISSFYCPSVIFVEKPVCCSREEFDTLNQMLSEKDVQVIVNHSRRFDPRYHELREEVVPYLGQLINTRCLYYGGWINNGVHLLDLLLYLNEGPIIWLEKTGMKVSRSEHDPSFEFVGKYARNGSPIFINAIQEPLFQLFELDFWFEKGRIRIEDFGVSILVSKKIINSSGECVLSKSQHFSEVSKRTPIDNAYAKLYEYLLNEEQQSIVGHRICDVFETMNTLWSARSLKLKSTKGASI